MAPSQAAVLKTTPLGTVLPNRSFLSLCQPQKLCDLHLLD